jgi:hypothetical protein
VIAEAKLRDLTVVTYEGRTFSGAPTRRWDRQMPCICQRHSVAMLDAPRGAHGSLRVVLGGSPAGTLVPWQRIIGLRKEHSYA